METALFRIRGNQQGMMGMVCECNPEGTNNLCCGEDLKTLIPDDSLRRALVQVGPGGSLQGRAASMYHQL